MPTLKANELICVGCLMPTLIDECETANMFGEEGMACRDCRTALNEFLYGGSDMVDNAPVNTNHNSSVPATTTTYKPSTIPATTYSGCKHHLEPFEFEKWTVYLTGSTHTKDKALSDWPDAGVYLDKGAWFNDTIACTDGEDVSADSPWPSLFIAWPDAKSVSLDVLEVGIAWAQKKIEAGLHLEIACVGGHGRTGTFTVALMTAMGFTTFDAFTLMRDTYCDKAIETREQVELLRKWEKRIHGI